MEPHGFTFGKDAVREKITAMQKYMSLTESLDNKKNEEESLEVLNSMAVKIKDHLGNLNDSLDGEIEKILPFM